MTTRKLERRRISARFERRVQDRAFQVAMAGIRLGVEPTKAELALLRDADRYTFEAAQHQHSKEARKTMNQLDQAKYDANVIAIAENRGRVAAMRESATRDPDFVEALRVQCWHRASPSSLRVAEDRETVIAPPGWPVGFDGPTYVATELDGIAEAVTERSDFERWKAQRNGGR